MAAWKKTFENPDDFIYDPNFIEINSGGRPTIAGRNGVWHIVKHIATVTAESLIRYTESISIPGTSKVNKRIEVDGVPYFLASAETWSISINEGSSNATILPSDAVKFLDISIGAEVREQWLFKSDSVLDIPEITLAELEFDFYAGGSDIPDDKKCKVYGRERLGSGPPLVGAKITAILEKGVYIGNVEITPTESTVETRPETEDEEEKNDAGYFEFGPPGEFLVRGGTYIFEKRRENSDVIYESFRATIPDVADLDINKFNLTGEVT